jgi:hypothetical protein
MGRSHEDAARFSYLAAKMIILGEGAGGAKAAVPRGDLGGSATFADVVAGRGRYQQDGADPLVPGALGEDFDPFASIARWQARTRTPYSSRATTPMKSLSGRRPMC